MLIELENPNIIKPRLSAPCSTFLKIVHTSKDTCECSLFAYWKTIIFAKSFPRQWQGGGAGPEGGTINIVGRGWGTVVLLYGGLE